MEESPQARTPEEEQAIRLFEELDHIRRIWTGYRPSAPLTRSDMMLLGNITMLTQQKKPVTVSSLASLMRQSLPGISQKVSVLEEQGYIWRSTHGKDKRVVELTLTEKGEKVSLEAMEGLLHYMGAVLKDMGPEKSAQFLELMHAFILSIEKVKTQEDKEIL